VDIRILALGDVVGKPGRKAVVAWLPGFRAERKIDFAIVNAENAAGGSGITPRIARDLFRAGADALTSGDHIFKNKEVEAIIDEEPRLLRPLNISRLARGRGWGVYETAGGTKVGVANVQGRLFIRPADNPFDAIDRALDEFEAADVRVVCVDVHAEATSEKIALGWHLSGRASFVFGTHTHVQTADERILPGEPGGTAYITDLGMTGPFNSVIGRRTDRVLASMHTGMPERFDVAAGDTCVSGALATVDAATGRARAIERVYAQVEA